VVNVRDLTTGETLPELSVPASMSTLAFAPTGHVLAVGTNDGTEIWELPDVRRVAVLAGQATSTGGAAVDSTGALAYSVSLDGTVVRWDVDARSSIFQRVDAPMDRFVPGAMLRDWGMMGPTADAYYILQDRVAIRDGETGDLRDPILLPDHPSAPGSAAIHAVTESPDGSRIAVGTGWGVTWLFDRDTGEELARWDTADEDWRSVRSVAFSSDGERLAVGLSNDTLQRPDGTYPAPREDVFLLDGHTLEPVGDPIEVPQSGVSGISKLAFDPSDEQLLVQHHRDWVGDWGDRTPAPVFVAVYDVETGGRKWRSSADSLGMAWSPDGRQIVIGGGDGRIQLLDATDGETLVGPMEAHDGFAEDVSFSPDGQLVLSAGTDSKVRLWSASDLSPSGTFTPTEGSAGGEAARFVGSGSTVRMLYGLQVWSAPVDPADLGAHICSVIGRDLTDEEWSALGPGRPAPRLCG
jgi:WD40 repeat protein